MQVRLVIHSVAANRYHLWLSPMSSAKDLETHAIHRHVDTMLNVMRTVRHHRANAKPTMWDHLRIVDRNALRIPIVQRNMRVLIENAGILVQTHVVHWPNATSSVTQCHVFVRRHIPEIHLCNVLDGSNRLTRVNQHLVARTLNAHNVTVSVHVGASKIIMETHTKDVVLNVF